jgi:dipeptidyl aminopeptidase/acylaminoacyl peptidase
VPAYVTRDGKTGYLISQRKSGPDVVEKYDFATGTRTELYADADSDPLSVLVSLDGNEAIGAYYDATDPKPHFWSPAHPDAQMGLELQAAFPGERVRQLDHSKDGNVVILGVSSDHDRGSWYEFDRQAGKVSKITKRAPWLDATKQGTQTAFELAARDGLPLHGVLTLPPASAGKNLPLVVVPHGGPFGVSDRKGYDLDDQILAQHGYAVLQLNFRGSSDYGRAFVAAGARQWGAAMQDDLTDATRWAIAQGIADPQRICIYGMSYGGYAALMGPIREPGLYKCAASYAGPSDLTRMTKWGNARRTELSKKWHVKMLGEPATLAAVSPALNADKIKVPVLLAHGIVDSRVDIRHTQAMRRELEKSGTPVDYVEYSATGHWLYDEHREDFYARLLRLLDANIGAGARPSGQATAPQ